MSFLLTRSARAALATLGGVMLLTLPNIAGAQSRITAAVDENQRMVLKGGTHPLARAEFDQGLAPATLAMDRMLISLKRSPEQAAALAKFAAEQQDPTSPNY